MDDPITSIVIFVLFILGIWGFVPTPWNVVILATIVIVFLYSVFSGIAQSGRYDRVNKEIENHLDEIVKWTYKNN